MSGFKLPEAPSRELYNDNDPYTKSTMPSHVAPHGLYRRTQLDFEKKRDSKNSMSMNFLPPREQITQSHATLQEYSHSPI
jgi:hypothetical protein